MCLAIRRRDPQVRKGKRNSEPNGRVSEQIGGYKLVAELQIWRVPVRRASSAPPETCEAWQMMR